MKWSKMRDKWDNWLSLTEADRRLKRRIIRTSLVLSPFIAMAAGFSAVKGIDNLVNNNPEPTKEFTLNKMDITDNVLTIEGQSLDDPKQTEKTQWDVIEGDYDYYDSPEGATHRAVLVQADDGQYEVHIQEGINTWTEKDANGFTFIGDVVAGAFTDANRKATNIKDALDSRKDSKFSSHVVKDDATFWDIMGDAGSALKHDAGVFLDAVFNAPDKSPQSELSDRIDNTVLDLKGGIFDGKEPQKIFKVDAFQMNQTDVTEIFEHPGQPNRNPKPIYLNIKQ